MTLAILATAFSSNAFMYRALPPATRKFIRFGNARSCCHIVLNMISPQATAQYTAVFLQLLILGPSQSSSLTMDVKVVAGEGEAMESLLRRFKREVNKSGHLMELRHRRYFEDSQDLKKRKIKEQRRRMKMERMQNRKNNRFQN